MKISNRKMDSGEDRLFRLPFKLPSSISAKKFCVYFAGGLYGIGIWSFLDCVLYSKHANGSDLHITFTDWIPIICSILGMLIVSSIEKNRLLQDALSSGSFTGSQSTAWQARVVLFLGFSLLAGGISGSFVILIVKFFLNDYGSYPTLGMGVNNVLANMCLVLSCVVLWIGQNVEDEYNYSLTL